jgi:hypothetical protein
VWWWEGRRWSTRHAHTDTGGARMHTHRSIHTQEHTHTHRRSQDDAHSEEHTQAEC